MKKTAPNSKDVKAEAEKMLSRMLGVLDPASIIRVTQHGVLTIGGEKALPERISNLKSEAEFILKSDLWKLLEETVRQAAYDIMFTKSKDFDDVRSGKMLLYHLDMQRKNMETLRSYQQTPPPLRRAGVL